MIFKVCLNCKALVKKNEDKCPICGGTSFSVKFKGAIFILNLEKSELGKMAGKEKEGIYALKVEK